MAVVRDAAHSRNNYSPVQTLAGTLWGTVQSPGQQQPHQRCVERRAEGANVDPWPCVCRPCRALLRLLWKLWWWECFVWELQGGGL